VQFDRAAKPARGRKNDTAVTKAAAQAMAILLAALQPQKTAAFCTDWQTECPDCAVMDIPGMDVMKWLSMLLNVALIAFILYAIATLRVVKVEMMTQTFESSFHPKPGRSIACQSQTSYKWWWAKPEFRVLPAAAAGCSFAYL